MPAPDHVIFVKHPEPGRAKTRLGAAVGMDRAAALARAFAEATLERYRAAGRGPTVFFAPPEREADLRAWLGPELEYAPQRGRDLGRRMRRAFEERFARGARAVILAGTDVPDLDPARILDAEQALTHCDAVLGPAEDGGYHLIGMTRRGFLPDVFEDTPWSTPQVLPRTLAKLTHSGMSIHQLPPAADVDTLADLQALHARLAARGAADTPLGRLVAETLNAAGGAQ